jgi:hypothetical protein
MARPGRKCCVCIADPVLLAKTNALLEAGESFRAISALTGFNKFAIQRHKRHAFPPTESEPENLDDLQLSERRLESLANRLEAQYSAAIACSDGKLGVDILKTLSRVEAERHHRIVDRKEDEANADASDPIKAGAPCPAFLDYVKNKVAQAYNRAVVTGMVWCPFGCNKPVDPRIIPERIRAYMEANSGNLNIAN